MEELTEIIVKAIDYGLNRRIVVAKGRLKKGAERFGCNFGACVKEGHEVSVYITEKNRFVKEVARVSSRFDEKESRYVVDIKAAKYLICGISDLFQWDCTSYSNKVLEFVGEKGLFLNVDLLEDSVKIDSEMDKKRIDFFFGE